MTVKQDAATTTAKTTDKHEQFRVIFGFWRSVLGNCNKCNKHG